MRIAYALVGVDSFVIALQERVRSDRQDDVRQAGYQFVGVHSTAVRQVVLRLSYL